MAPITRTLIRKPIPFILIDREPSLTCDAHVAVHGGAAVRQPLRQAGIDRAGGIIVTTNDDSTNIFFTLACRRLTGPATHERPVHDRTGAFVQRLSGTRDNHRRRPSCADSSCPLRRPCR
uniref:RCK N-terminal domain-containing protein n=1 Tax=Geobacter metallireducens TaxID=28232 RepID=A0A831XMZ3_GEOME